MNRLFDVIVAGSGLILLTPLILVLYAVIYFKLGRPVFFLQERPGKDEKPFKIVKFRTMLDAVDEQGHVLPDEQRLTQFGKWLRASSLDELPELWNVLKGDMALVGPRPLLMEYLGKYSDEQARRHSVRPGITGWAQVNGRNDIDWDEKLALDIWYVDNRSFALDVKILMMTIGRVCSGSGVSKSGHATTDKFPGSRP